MKSDVGARVTILPKDSSCIFEDDWAFEIGGFKFQKASAVDLFRRSNPALRQQLLSFMLSDIELNDKKLSYELTHPFKEIAEANKKGSLEPNSRKWQGWLDAFRTAAIMWHEDRRLRMLAEAFELKDELSLCLVG